MMGCQNLLQWVQFGNLDAYCMRKGGENEVNNTSADIKPKMCNSGINMKCFASVWGGILFYQDGVCSNHCSLSPNRSHINLGSPRLTRGVM